MIGIALAALLLGGWLPGGTWWLTPLASGALGALAYFGRQSPAVLVALIDGEFAEIGRLAWARRYAGLGTLLLPGLPLGLIQYNAGLSGQAVGIGVNGMSAGSVVTARPRLAPVQITFTPQTRAIPREASGFVRGTLRIQTGTSSFALPARTQPGGSGDLLAGVPAARVAWGWADADLLPDLLIIIRPAESTGSVAAERTFYVPLTGCTIREQSALTAAAWSWAPIGYGVAAGAFLLYGALRGLFRLLAWGLNQRFSPRA